MSYSLGEIEAMCKRAARGAGLSWGLAEEAAKASRWLTAFGLPGPQMLASLLQLNDHMTIGEVTPMSLSGEWSGSVGRLCPLCAGAAMSDCADRLQAGEDISMQDVTQPLLIVPFAASAALNIGSPVEVEWDGMRMSTDGHTLSIQGNRESIAKQHTVSLKCTTRIAVTDPAKPVTRGQLDAACWRKLSEFANRTYAPATEESRLLGAGADVADND